MKTEVKQMVADALSRLELDRTKNIKEQISFGQYIEDYQLIQISLQRGAGHTSTAIELMQEYPNSFCVTVDDNTKKHMESLMWYFYRDWMDNISKRTVITTSPELHWPEINEDKYDIMIIDDASKIPTSRLSTLYARYSDKVKLILELQ